MHRRTWAAAVAAQFSGDSAITTDEESSGILDAREHLGRGWYLFDAQVHKAIAPDPDELVEHGRLLALRVDDFDDVYTAGVRATRR